MDLRPLRERARRPTRLERRLQGWLLVLALTPVLLLLGLGTWLGLGSLGLLGTLGPWGQVAESGRALFEAADGVPTLDPELADALERHRRDLSSSLVLARRWEFLGGRISAALPAAALALAALFGALALGVSRRLAVDLSRPIHELVDWAGRLAREEPLPPPTPREANEVREVQVLRGALRSAATDLSAGRERALEAERVRIWGEMARRVAHEMKNPLTPLRLATARLSAGAAPEDEEALRVIEEETARLEELASQFASLGRPPAGPKSEVDLRELLESLVATDVPPGVVCELRAPPGAPRIEAHYDDLVRAFRNLVRNAVEAVDSRGGIRVEVRVAEPARAGEGGDGEGAAAGDVAWIDVLVADTGPGVPPELRERIFEPDFTTRSRGTGLGLALVRQTVAAHGGEVGVREAAGGGAEFVVRLPLSRAPATS